MAGDWMKVEKVTPSKPEVEGIADRLDLDPDAVFGKLFRVWSWFDDHTLDGNANSNGTRVTKKSIDRKAGVAGFADAMVQVGWLREDGGLVTIPNFDRHNTESAKQRALAARRSSKLRAKSHASVDANSHAQRNGTRVTKCDAREEKRREDIPSPLPPSEAPAENDTDRYGEVVEKLLSVGVVAAKATAQALESNAAPPELAIRVIEHWQVNSPAWGQGALVMRLENLGPGQNPAEGWPEISKAAETEKRRAEEQRKLEKQLSEREKADQERDKNARRRAAIEAAYGHVIDGLNAEQQRSIIQRYAKELAPMLLPRITDKSNAFGLVRETLGEILDRIATGEIQAEPDG